MNSRGAFCLDQTLKTSGDQGMRDHHSFYTLSKSDSEQSGTHCSGFHCKYVSNVISFPPPSALKCQMPRLEDHCWSCSCASRVETKHPSSGANWLASKAEEMMSIITSVLSNAYGSLHDVRTANLIRRGLVLFTVGVILALVLNLLQIQRNVTLFPEEVMTTLFSSAWWIPPCCGTGAGECVGIWSLSVCYE